MQTSSPRSSDAARLQIPPLNPIVSQSPEPTGQALLPNPPASLHTRHRPKFFASAETAHRVSLKRASPHRDPEYLLDEPRTPESTPGYQRRYAACARGLSSPHRSLWGPFFCRLGALTVEDGCTWAGFASFFLAQKVSQGVMDLGPSAVLFPGPKVVIDRLVGRKIAGQHPPSTTTAADVEDGVDDMPQDSRTGATTATSSRQQGRNDIPFGIRYVAWISHRQDDSTLRRNFSDTL